MPSKYLVSEPVPSTPSYIRYGRGGAGNIVRNSASSSASKASSKTALAPSVSSSSSSTTSSSSSSRQPHFFSGRGGMGNAHDASRRTLPSLEDEINRAAARDLAPTGHCGIGGAGNVYSRKPSDASSASSAASRSSSGSTSKLWARVSSSFGRE